MEFIAAYWWVWLISLLLCGGFGIWRWLMNFLKTGGTMLKVANLTLEGVQVAADNEKTIKDKAGHVQTRVMEEALEEGKSRLRGFAAAGAAIVMANIFGVLLIIAVVIHFIDYIKQ